MILLKSTHGRRPSLFEENQGILHVITSKEIVVLKSHITYFRSDSLARLGSQIFSK